MTIPHAALTLFVLTLLLASPSNSSFPKESWNRTFEAMLTTFHEEYPGPLKDESTMIKALDACVKSIDKHASFLGPQDYAQLKHTTEGGLVRTGLTLGPKDDRDSFLMILAVKKGSTAAQAGIQRYDTIKAINGVPVGPFSLEKAATVLEKSAHLPITLRIAREGHEERAYILKPCFMPKKSCRSCPMPEKSLVYYRIKLFTEQTASQLEKELVQTVTKSTRGIIIDVRNNPGGLLQSAINCAALFVEKNSLIVSTRNLHGKSIAHYRTARAPLIRATPLVLLVNHTTASAAEIFAQALRIYAAQAAHGLFVTIVGTPTAGKGSLQRIRPLNEQYALKVTTALSIMADGTTFHTQGIKPDFSIATQSNSYEQLLPQSSPITTTTNCLSNLESCLFTKTLQHSYRRSVDSNDPHIACACTLIALLSHAHTYTPQLIPSYAKKLSWLQAHYLMPSTLGTSSNSPNRMT